MKSRKILTSLCFLTIVSALAAPVFAVREPDKTFELGSLGEHDLARIEDLAKKGGAAGDFFKLKRADYLLNAGQADAAATLAQKVSFDVLAIWKNAVLAEVLNKSGKHDEALKLLDKVPARPRPEFSFGETSYLQVYRRFISERVSALTSLGKDASFEKGELVATTPDNEAPADPASLTVEQRMALVGRLRFAYQYKKIGPWLSPEEIVSSSASHEEQCQALYDLGDSLRRNAGQLEMGMAAFEKLVSHKCDDGITARGLYWLGHGAVSLKKEDLAVSTLTRLYKNHSQHRLADDAFDLLRRLYQKLGNTAKAAQYEEKLLSWHKGDMRNALLFEEGYASFKKGDYKKAIAAFAPIENSDVTPDESHPQVLYWLARSHEKAGSKKSKVLYRKVVAEFPFSFHAVLAANRLGTTVKVPDFPVMGGSAPSDGDQIFSLIDELTRGAFYDEASAVMDFAVHLNPSWEKSHEEFIARKYMECRNYRKALEMAAQHFDSGVYGLTAPSSDPMFAAFYPKAYARQTSRGYQLTGLPRGAIEGIMREESLFQRNARSWVGATGLMQLMPTTAQMVRRKLASAGDLSDLTDPQSNILLGSTYLEDMRDFFNGYLPFAIMAYNAGPGNVKKWQRNIGASELDEFIEDVPFSETKGYVKRVLRSMQVYGALYRDPYFKKPFFNFKLRS